MKKSKLKRFLTYVVPFVALILIFGLALACSETTAKPEEIKEELVEEPEEEIEEAIEEEPATVEEPIEEEKEPTKPTSRKNPATLGELLKMNTIKKSL